MRKIIALVLTAMLAFAVCAMAETGESGRTPAPYTFALSEGEEQYYENLIFNGDVIVNGNNAQITFVNCQFNGDIINTADEYTRVFLVGGCEINGRCVLSNSIQESTLEAAFPKFLLDAPAEVVVEDCFGAVICLGDFEVTFNGEPYSVASAEVFFDNNNPDAGVIPYEGQQANVLVVCRWWENGEEILFTQAEFDPGM